jgi:hypothetical protein
MALFLVILRMSDTSGPMLQASPPKLWSEQESAAQLGISVSTLRRERRLGRIGYTMIGGRPRYTEQHLTAYIVAREVTPCEATNNPTDRGRSDSFGSAGVGTAGCGTVHGSTPGPDKRAEHLLALQILRNCSPWGNDATLGTGSSGGQVILKQP